MASPLLLAARVMRAGNGRQKKIDRATFTT